MQRGGRANGFDLNISVPVNIAYNDFEEFYLIDYAFSPGYWVFDLFVEKKEDWHGRLEFSSLQHPGYGMHLKVDPIEKDRLYDVDLNLKTHYFGGIKGDLTLPIRSGGLYPLPSGTLDIDNVRFIINGLIFSGRAVVNTVTNENAMDIQAYNVAMNNGHVGNAGVTMSFDSSGGLYIKPFPIENPAVTLNADIAGSDVLVDIDALAVDGDFFAQNIKIPIFGIKDSIYKGHVKVFKNGRGDPVKLDGALKGYRDGLEQIDALVTLEGSRITIPKFHILSPDIFITGDVCIKSFFSNTVVEILGEASIMGGQKMPVDINVDAQKGNAFVKGVIDDTITLSTATIGTDTTMVLDFPDFRMNRLGMIGTINGQLNMNFGADGVDRFNIDKVKWRLLSNRTAYVNFDAVRNSEGQLYTKDISIGLDREILNGDGYFLFGDNQFIMSFLFTGGDSVQFNMGKYVMKSRIKLVKFIVDNIFEFEIFDALDMFRDESTETVAIDLDLNLSGALDNLTASGFFHMEDLDSAEDFIVAVPEFYVSREKLSLQNVRLRHSALNADADAVLDVYPDESMIAALVGSFAYGKEIKSDFSFGYRKDAVTGVLDYDLSSLYILTKKPITLQGSLYHDGSEFFFAPKNNNYGIAGYGAVGDISTWDISLLTDAVRLNTAGAVDETNSIDADLNVDVILDGLALTGDFRRVRGGITVESSIKGSMDEPIVNGIIGLDNINIALRSIRNNIILSNDQYIYISNNNMLIPDLAITADGGGQFGLNGAIGYNDGIIDNIDIRFASTVPRNNYEASFITWNMNVPLIRLRGRTFIEEVSVTGSIEDMLVNARIDADNINLTLEIDEALGAMPAASGSPNAALALLGAINIDAELNLLSRTRFASPIFNMDIEQVRPIKASGNLGDDTFVLTGEFDITSGRITYLNSTLNIVSGEIGFSGEDGDFFPSINVETEMSKDIGNENVDIFVRFDGKIPDFELANISSVPTKSRQELLNILSGAGVTATSSRSSSEELLASTVGIAENSFFTDPLTRRLQRVIPFIDTLELRTDILGNIARSANSSGNISGAGLLDGTELGIGYYIPGLRGLQATYDFRLESADANQNFDSGSLNQTHKIGLQWTRNLPNQWRIGVGANISTELSPTAVSTVEHTTQPEGVIEFKRRF